MLRYRYETEFTSCIKELLQISSNGNKYVTITGMDVTQLDDYNIKISEGSFIIIENPFIIDNYQDMNEDVRNIAPTIQNTTFHDGYHILMAVMEPPTFSEINLKLHYQNSDGTWDDVPSDKYAVFAIIHVAGGKINEILNTYYQWHRFEYNDIFNQLITSVNGMTGDVVLTTDNIPEGSNKYYTDARVSSNPTVALNSQNRHHHNNKSVLDNITASYTIEEKVKLSGLESSHFKGVFATLTDLENNVSNPIPGDYAYVDGGQNVNIQNYIWDPSDNIWVEADFHELTPAQIKSLYESNPDTNAFTDADKNNLNNHIVDTNNPHNVTASQIGGSNILNELKTVDGENSGLDADLLDGHHASDFILNTSGHSVTDLAPDWTNDIADYIVLRDQTSGNKYKLYIDNDQLKFEEIT